MARPPDVRLARGDLILIQIVDRAMTEAAQLAGARLAWRPGCTECCIGPFPITALDARRLRAGLAELDRVDPVKAARVRERAALAAAVTQPYAAEPEEEFAARFATMPCSALEPSSGWCDLYAWRPVACRTFGPPVRFGEDEPPPCRLCFAGADNREVERCRVDVDPDGLEEALLAELDEPDTIVAFALAADQAPPASL